MADRALLIVSIAATGVAGKKLRALKKFFCKQLNHEVR